MARRVITALFNIAPIDAEDFDYDLFDLPRLDPVTRKNTQQAIPSSLQKYKMEVRRQLAAGDIAEHFLDHWYHNDFYRALPTTIAWWYRMYRPRSIEQISKHVCKHLSWYLNRHKPYANARVYLIPIAYLSLVVVFTGYYLTLLISGPAFASVFTFLCFISLIFYALWFLLGRTGFVPAARQEISKAEFYLYMRDKLRDFEPQGVSDLGQETRDISLG